jgi:putative tryptophan/tyrosine transport system substrate-binding protein
MRFGAPAAQRPAAWLVLAAGLLAAACAQAGPARVALLKSSALDPYEQATAAFVAAHPGPVSTFTLEGADPGDIARRIGAQRPAAIVAVGLKAALFARDRLPRVPLVFCVVPNHDRFDLSGAGITGVSADVGPERDLEALKAVAPDARRVALLCGRTSGELVRRARAAAAAQGLILVEIPVSDPTELRRVAREVAGRVDALWLPADPAVATPEAFRFLLELSLGTQRPLLTFSESLVRSGALVSMSPDYAWIGGQAAELVRRIDGGERPGDISVVPLRRAHPVVNAATARALGRELPATLPPDVEVLR